MSKSLLLAEIRWTSLEIMAWINNHIHILIKWLDIITSPCPIFNDAVTNMWCDVMFICFYPSICYQNNLEKFILSKIHKYSIKMPIFSIPVCFRPEVFDNVWNAWFRQHLNDTSSIVHAYGLHVCRRSKNALSTFLSLETSALAIFFMTDNYGDCSLLFLSSASTRLQP